MTSAQAYPYLLSLPEFSQHFPAAAERLASQNLIRLPGNQAGIPPGVVRTQLRQDGFDYSPHILALLNLKGGVGKTTSAVSLASRAAQYGYQTCLIDLDSQASATLALGLMPQADDPVFIDIWQQPDEFLPAALWPVQDGFSVLPSSLENGLLDVSLANPVQQKNALRQVCQRLQDCDYELIIIDCPPSLGAAVISAACAAQTIIIPVTFDVFSQHGLRLTRQEVTAICDTFGLSAPLFRILFTQYDRRIKQATVTLEQLQHDHGECLIPVPIRTNTAYAKASRSGKTIFASHSQSIAKADYDACWRYLMSNL